MDCLNTKSVLALSSTSSAIRTSIRENEWNINRKLKRFVKELVAFRTLLGRHNGLISGSFALQFFERVTFKCSGLDLFFDIDSGYEKMIDHLVTQESYVVKEKLIHDHLHSHWQPDLAEHEINAMATFEVR
jgi:hypothetical protein